VTACPHCDKPLLVDLFCGAGGAGVGYTRAGFCVVGVDDKWQPDYPFPIRHGDALAVLRDLLLELPVWFSGHGLIRLHQVAGFHASPPCQNETALTKGNRKRDGWTDDHRPMIPATRELLDATGLPYVIENVQGAPLRRDLTLCGEQFGLEVIRHRFFELGGWSTQPLPHVKHRGRVAGWRHGVKYEGPYVAVYGDGGGKGSVADWQRAMGIDWTASKLSLAEAIPPAYSEFVGSRLMEHLEREAAA